MSKLLKVLFTLFLLSPLFVFSQVPVAPSNGLWGIIASQYQVGTAAQGTTQAKITLQNNVSIFLKLQIFKFIKHIRHIQHYIRILYGAFNERHHGFM